MLHNEFAIAPEQIQDIRDLRFLEARFGFNKGALISAFPKRWFAQVAERLKLSLGDAQVDRISDDLKQFKEQCVLGFSRDFNSGKQWIDSVLESNQTKPFHRIIEQSLNQPPEFISNIHALRDHDFFNPNQVSRTSQALADAAELLLINAEKVTLFDPYFCLTDKPYQKTFLEIIQKCQKPKVTFNIFCKEENKPDWQTSRKPDIEEFAANNLANGQKLRWFSISDNGSGAIHPRGLFTGKGGINYDRGFAEPNAHEQRNELTDVSIMNAVELQQKSSDYNDTQISDKFTIVNQWFSN